MKKKPRRPKPLYLFSSELPSAVINIQTDLVIIMMACEMPDLKQVKRLMKWLKQATEYLEAKEGK